MLSADDVALYRQIFAAERDGETATAKTLFAKVSDHVPGGLCRGRSTSCRLAKRVTVEPLVEWLTQYRDLAVADRIYRLAVAHSTKKVRRHHKTITVAVVTNIPAPSGVGRRTGGYEDLELPEPVPSSEAARARAAGILAAIKAGQPDQALALLQRLQAAGTAPTMSRSWPIASPPPIWPKAAMPRPTSWPISRLRSAACRN